MVRTSKVFGGCFRVPKRGKVAPSGNGDGVFTINYLSSTSTLDIASAPAPPPTPAPEMQARHSLLWHLLLDLPILLAVAGICVLLEVGVVPSHRAGFTCHDPALSFPYSGETFSIPMLAVLTLLVPFLTIWIAEATQCQQSEYILKRRVCVSARATGLVFRDYLYGAVMNVALLEVIKCAVGSPRPTFFDLCEPDKEKTCNGSDFVTEYECTSQRYSRYLIIDSSRSFPSAHASLAVYCGFFVAWYLQRRVFSWHTRSALLVPLVQLLALSFAAVSALSRVSDRRHHWWDVLAGAFAGFCTLLYTVLVLCKNFYQPGVESTSDLSSDNNHPSVRRLLASDTRVAIA